MKRAFFVFLFAGVLAYAGSAMAQSACEGDPTDQTNPSACGPCLPDGEPGTDGAGCIALCGESDAGSGCLCVGGSAAAGAGCIAAQDDAGGGTFICTGEGGMPNLECDLAACQAAAQAACSGS